MKDKLKGKEEEILKLWGDGLAMKELASRYDVAPSSIRAFLNRHQKDTSRKIQVAIPKLEIADAAYIAGIIDGEGCITARWLASRGTYYVQSFITIGTSSENLAKYLQRVTGNGSEGSYKRNGKELWRPLYIWTISSWQGAELLRQILPYLQIKREQAELFIELTEIKLQSRPGHRFNEERQKEIVERIRVLNKRGMNTVLPVDITEVNK